MSVCCVHTRGTPENKPLVPALRGATARVVECDHGKVPDMLAWVLHDYWLHCKYAGDRERMRDKLFPLLRKNVNGYLNYHINGIAANNQQVRRGESGMYEITLNKGDCVTFTPVELDKADLTIEPIRVSKANRNLFGLSDKTTRLPGHAFYYRQ